MIGFSDNIEKYINCLFTGKTHSFLIGCLIDTSKNE